MVDTGSGKAEVVKPVSAGDAFIFVSAEYISVFITFVINITIDRRCRDHLLPTPSLLFACTRPYQTTIPRDHFFHLDFCLVHFMTTLTILSTPTKLTKLTTLKIKKINAKSALFALSCSKFHMSRDSFSRLHFCATNIYSTGREPQNNLVFVKE